MTRERGPLTGVAVVFVAALALRLLFLIEFANIPLFDSPTMDMLYHDLWAQDILAGQGASYAPFFRAPLYPYFLAGIYLLFGTGGWAAGIVQGVLGSLSAAVVFLIGRRIAGQIPAMVAGLLLAVWGPVIFYDAQRLVPSLSILLNLVALYLLLPDGPQMSRRRTALGGLCLGLSAVARPTILAFAGVYAVCIMLRARQRLVGVTWMHVGLYLAALVAPILPVAVYNLAVSGQPVLIGTYSGLNFYIGNHQGADGTSAQLPGARQDWWGMMEDAGDRAHSEAGRPLNESEQSAFWWRKAKGEILSDPLAWTSLLGRKSIYLLQGIELSNNIDFYYFAHRTRLLRLLVLDGPVFVPWGLFVPMALIGLIVGFRQSFGTRLLAWFALSYGATLVLFFVTARYRLPLVPVVILLAVLGAQFLWREWRRRSALWRTSTLAFVALAYLVANVDFFHHAPRTEAPGLFAMAAAFERTHDLDLAEQYYRAAQAADPTFVQAHNDLGLLRIKRGDPKGAIETLSAGLQAVPDELTLRYNLAYAHLLAGEGEPAVPLLRSVLKAQPDNVDALNNLGTAFNLTRRFDSARVCFEQALIREPLFHAARFGLGWALEEQGQFDSARACFRAAAEAEVNVAESRYRMAQTWIAQGNADSAIADLRLCLARLSADHSDAAGEIKALLDSLIRR